MSGILCEGRSTADIVTSLRTKSGFFKGMDVPHTAILFTEAADRLAELQAKIDAIAVIRDRAVAAIPCLDPGVPWDALADIMAVLR